MITLLSVTSSLVTAANTGLLYVCCCSYQMIAHDICIYHVLNVVSDVVVGEVVVVEQLSCQGNLLHCIIITKY